MDLESLENVSIVSEGTAQGDNVNFAQDSRIWAWLLTNLENGTRSRAGDLALSS